MPRWESAVKSGDTLCIIYDLSYLEMVISNPDPTADQLLTSGQKVQITADAVQDTRTMWVLLICRLMKHFQRRHHHLPGDHPRERETDGCGPARTPAPRLWLAEAAIAVKCPMRPSSGADMCW